MESPAFAQFALRVHASEAQLWLRWGPREGRGDAWRTGDGDARLMKKLPGEDVEGNRSAIVTAGKLAPDSLQGGVDSHAMMLERLKRFLGEGAVSDVELWWQSWPARSKKFPDSDWAAAQ